MAYMKSSFGDAILSGVGKLYLQLRFGKGEIEQQELIRKYEGRYRNAGLVLLFDLLMAFAVVAVISLIAAVLYIVIA